MNLNVHFHTCFLDGVYARDAAGALAFHAAPPPNRDDLEDVVRVVHRRALQWLERHGRLGRRPLEERSNEAPLVSPMEACAAIATQRGTMRSLTPEADSPELARAAMRVVAEAPAREGGAVEHESFNLHASVRIAAEDDLGRERLCRYGTRPPFSLDRLRVIPGGRITYRIKKLGGGRAKHRVMTPLELLARLSALVPPPRYPLVRFHGVLAPNAAWRREIVPRPPTDSSSLSGEVSPAAKKAPCSPSARLDRAAAATAKDEPSADGVGVRTQASGGRAGESVRDIRATAAAGCGLLQSSGVEPLTPNVLSVRHWSRLLGGLLYATSPRLRWSLLQRRSFDVDVLECPKCHGRIRVLEAVIEADATRAILERLGLRTDAPQLVRARDPTTLDGEEPDAA